MMRTRNVVIGLVAMFLLCAVSGSAMADINYLYEIDSDTTLTTPYIDHPSVIVDNFDSDRPAAWNYSGNGAIVSGSASGLYAAPYNSLLMAAEDPTNYYTVPLDLNQSPLSATVSFGATYDYLGLFWGSVDTYNTFEFFKDGNLVATFSGQDITNPSPANGNQTAPSTNLYVNFVDIPAFDTVRFTSTSYAFEFDNLAVGSVVPVPGAVLLGLLGLGVAGRKLRKRA